MKGWKNGHPVVRALLIACVLTLCGGLAALSITLSQPPAGPPQLLFGLGPEAKGARESRLARHAPVRMLTSWYNSPGDLTWMSSPEWSGEVRRDYAAGYAMQLIVWSGGPTVPLTTTYGPACGRPYPVSPQFLGDMAALAQIYNGKGPLYVSLFAEFQTYTCVNNQWAGNQNYWRALQDQYLVAKAIFHQFAPNSRVSLCWGGWQGRWDDPKTGAGRSLFKHFAKVMAASDFQSFQALQSDTNVTDVEDMTRILHKWGPVMLAYYKPDDGSQAVFDADTHAMLTASFLAQETANGLFAWGFMDNANVAASAATYRWVKAAVRHYAAPWIVPPSLR